ncbi:sporulation peptidase YabG [Acetivibrio mesophilus]|uniref:Sporulation peptidase YabG n=1 Tax=Acetivibrio mesophilus TaxID=2487273 RepID=A0A4Q0I1P9_9FIRM|nr:sporulation peptidase YabG [Acetivibrio mesophilus]ODM27241.1 sporulation peptidase YabG [Clostridium sp. Bc-iso-3]RXE58061.1 sporulation peptidase YabG [Acetivibrio mesophilus]HHV29779.1 sporulation peptidase YabG [Clostridium sp.]
MSILNVGDIVARKSHGQDIYFTVIDIQNRDSAKPVYVLSGLFYRIIVDAYGDDLIKKDPRSVRMNLRRDLVRARSNAYRAMPASRCFLFGRPRQKPGKVLHIDSSESYLNMCRNLYREAGIKSSEYLADESEQPNIIRRALMETKPDILVVTGHDSLKKGSNPNSIDSYRNSKYFVECVREARKYQPDYDKLCIFAGACQSYFEAIMQAGANFASSPGRININALDPAIVSEKVALTDNKYFVTPEELSKLTVSGNKGIGGIKTRGHLVVL